ncbi:MAG: hypothetical protein JWM80_548 [Cyanobacteria bacterium RYN_339]|nr:hypothetical protein [Cyanobacteria bacterium RYN_339]
MADLQRLEALVDHVDALLAASVAAPTALQDLGLRHLAKGAASTRSALLLLREGRWPDACILTRAVIEQLFSYLWVVQDPLLAEARSRMVTLKQEWANAQYLEGLAATAAEPQRTRLAEAAVAYREAASVLLADLSAELGLTEKQVRTQANAKVSAKANEVQVDPRFSIPFAYYSGFVHTDGIALAHFAGYAAAPEPDLPVAADLHRTMLQLLLEVGSRVDLPLGFAHEQLTGL